MRLDERIGLVAEVTAAVSHALSGPVQRCLNLAFVARRSGSTGGVADIEGIEAGLDAIVRMVDRLRRLEAACRAPQRAWIRREVLAGALAHAFESRPEVRLVVVAPDTPIFVDVEALVTACAELVDNAAEFGAPEATITVRVGDDEASSMSVEGEAGRWPTPPEAAVDPLYTTKAQELGLGLAIAHAVATAHGGGLWIDPEHGRVRISHESAPSRPREVIVEPEIPSCRARGAPGRHRESGVTSGGAGPAAAPSPATAEPRPRGVRTTS